MEPDENFSDYSKDDEAAGLLELKVTPELGGLRLDQALVRLLPEYSRSRLQDWIEQALVMLDGKPATARQKVWGGEAIVVSPQLHPADQPCAPEDIPLDIVYKDDVILVLDKPVGLVVHPGSGNWHGTLLNALLFHDPQLAHLPRAGIVHRLDKDTSGLMVVARTLAAQTALVRQMQARSVKREYIALVWGELDRDYTINVPIGRHPTQRTRMAATEAGKEAITHVSILERYPSCTLVRCKLETGRTHQIRVHMAYIGHPLVGDTTYIKGVQKCVSPLRTLLNGFPRQALHATRLALDHPVSGERMQFDAPLPDDFDELLEQIEEASLEVE